MPPARALAQLLVGNQIQQAIYVAAKLGIADLLHGGPKSSDELAPAAGAEAAPLHRLLRALAGFGIFAETDDGRFSLTPLGELLRSGTPQSVRPFALWSGGVSYRAFGGLEETVRTGRPAFEAIFGFEFFEYLARHPESGSVFDEMMARHTAPVAAAVAASDFSGIETLVDIGGGGGELLAAVLRQHPTVHGVLLDAPRVLEQARKTLEAAGVADRCDVIAGDALESVPAGDAYVLKSIVHGLADTDAVRMLANCRRALRGDGKLVLVEFVLPPRNVPSPARLMDLLMLVGCYGRERTPEELAALLDAAGFRLAGITPAKHGYSLIEGRPAVAAELAEAPLRPAAAAR
jgi:SAM-dependent methyltransferase